jgi:hypothetical protein
MQNKFTGKEVNKKASGKNLFLQPILKRIDKGDQNGP